LKDHRDAIAAYLYIGYAVWDDLIARVQRQQARNPGTWTDEQAWTFLVGCGYAIAAGDGVAHLTEALTGADCPAPGNAKIWFEVLPVPPRRMEGETHLDLALGTIALRDGTGSGIRLDDAEAPWVCFCEMKWDSDISSSVSHDPHRNQLARVIENALCFQTFGRYAEKVYVTLVTPGVFRDAPFKSRLYQYKFEEYTASPARLVADLDRCILERNAQADWRHPSDLRERVASVSLRWVTYDELFEGLPPSPLQAELKGFWARYGGYQGRA